MSTDQGFEINPATYEWSVRLFTLLKKLVRVNLKLHHSGDAIERGEIFLFNHFARFETFIPQYFIYKETGAFCRSVAAGEFFDDEDAAFSNYLRRVGAVPNDHPRLLPFLAAEILRGRKVIVFPEGGMVKDRRVVDEDGGYSVYSRTARERRKHHTGAAVLALVLDAFKQQVQRAERRGDLRQVDRWANHLGFDTASLLRAANRPTTIVPANITFYPMRVRDNLLRKGAEILNRGLSRRLSEELLIEGNILLRDTDMDIRLARPVAVEGVWRWWHRRLIGQLSDSFDTLESAFELSADRSRWTTRTLGRVIRRHALSIRDEYMHRMYVSVTVNLSHLAARIVSHQVDRGVTELDADRFRRTLYLATKLAQRESSLNKHRSLRNPDAYAGLLEGDCAALDQFLGTATYSGLLEVDGACWRLMPKLQEEHGFDEIRLENFIEVYANEVAPLSAARRVVDDALAQVNELPAAELGRLRFEDQRIAFDWDRRAFDHEEHAAINRLETATESAEPFLLTPPEPSSTGVLLVHGFLASPAEVRGLGERLAACGHVVMGPRLRGHGTSPWDLRSRSWEDWLTSVRTGYSILAGFCDRICLVGFSTGGALALRLAADAPSGLAGVAAACVPFKFRNRNMRFIPLVHGANRLVRAVSSSDGLMPFRANDSEHPQINYRHIPVHALNELRLLVSELDRRLPDITGPVSLYQGDEDPVVDPSSMETIHQRIGRSDVATTMVRAKRHGIVNEDIDDTQSRIIDFVESVTG